ncbi:MAG TPA: ferredoxin [Firmicutes bacterium]|nr:ferredoxin [Bacillota bacterium]
MKAFVDHDTCIGCEACVGICPEVFHMNDDGKSVPIESDIPNELLDTAKDAEESCPVDAISIH